MGMDVQTTSQERLKAFLESFDPQPPQELARLEKWAKEEGVPIIRRDTASFLRTLLKIKRPCRVLEVGTGVGYSGLFFCTHGPEDLTLTTIESSPQRVQAAREVFQKAGRLGQVVLHEGDATEILPRLEPSFDFIFMDAAKGQYIHWLPEVRRLMQPGSILVSDNVFQEGEILESHFLVQRRDRTRYKRMREYLEVLSRDPAFSSTIVPVGDGLLLSVFL